MRAPGFGPLGFAIAMLAVGGVLVGQGHTFGGLVLDCLGAIALWSAFRADHPD